MIKKNVETLNAGFNGACVNDVSLKLLVSFKCSVVLLYKLLHSVSIPTPWRIPSIDGIIDEKDSPT